MHFFSDNAASVHPAVWAALHQSDTPDLAYDADRLSGQLDDAFSALFETPCAALWVATGTAANCLALAAMVPPHGAVLCHGQAHIETDEGGAPGFFLHGAKLMPLSGTGAKLSPETIAAHLARIRPGVHQVRPQAISISQSTELGTAYRPQEIAELGAAARTHGLRLHMDGARFANAAAFLGCRPATLTCNAGVDALSFGFVKNGGLGAEAIVFFDSDLAEQARHHRKRAGHLQSKGRFLAAQILALLRGDLWLENGRAANAAAAEIAAHCGDRLLHPVEANELFLRATMAERAVLRAQGFGFHDWDEHSVRLVTAWDSPGESVRALARAIRSL